MPTMALALAWGARRSDFAQVQDGGQAVNALNELEWVDGEVWANIWLTNCIARIDPASGAVKYALTPSISLDSSAYVPCSFFVPILMLVKERSVVIYCLHLQGLDHSDQSDEQPESPEPCPDLPHGCVER